MQNYAMKKIKILIIKEIFFIFKYFWNLIDKSKKFQKYNFYYSEN